MFMVSTSFDTKSNSSDVTPLVRPVVVSAETDSNNASSYVLPVRDSRMDAVIKATKT